MTPSLRPRHYAAAILAATGKAAREKILNTVPPDWRPLVREHVTSACLKSQALKHAKPE